MSTNIGIIIIIDMEIDFVVTWVDSNDPKWQEEFQKYKGITTTADQSKARYRDWDFFKYWFRSIEKYAPWVHKVYVITNGTFPSWINRDCQKLVLVKHSDYIPQQYLPTFNSRTIEFYMNSIPGLSEHFVYFNDDMYLNAPVSQEELLLLGDLLEALYSQNGEYALRQLKKIRPYLQHKGIEWKEYDKENAELFELLPTKKEASTLRPALVSGDKLLLPGRAAEHVD